MRKRYTKISSKGMSWMASEKNRFPSNGLKWYSKRRAYIYKTTLLPDGQKPKNMLP